MKSLLLVLIYNQNKKNMQYSSAMDGIPGIMPGTVQVPPPPIEIEERQPAPHCKKDRYRARETSDKPRHKIRMMPCNKE